jgi:hypothetical protein
MRIPALRAARLTIAAAAVAPALVVTAHTAQVPQIPATFYGAVTIDGEAPPAGTEVRGFIDGVDCTQPGAAGTIDAGDVGAYVISVMHESQHPGCASEGKEVTFTIGGRPAGQTATWEVGPHEVGLNAGEGSPRPLPPNVPTPTSQAAATASTPPATDDIDLPQTPPAVTPLPPGTSTSAGEDDGPPLWGFVVGALLGLGVLAGAAGFAMSRRGAAGGAGSGANGPGPD